SRGDERFGSGGAGRPAEGAGGDRKGSRIPVAEGSDQAVQSSSVRRLAAAGISVGEDRAAASWDVALDSAEVGDGAEGSSGEGRRRGRRLEDRGSADDLVPAGGRRNDQECRAASDAQDREPVENPIITQSART